MPSEPLPIAGFVLSKGGKRAYALVPVESLAGVQDLNPSPEARRVPLEALGGVEMAPNPIKVARMASGISQTALAAAMGISQARLSALEAESFPSPAAARRAWAVIRDQASTGQGAGDPG